MWDDTRRVKASGIETELEAGTRDVERISLVLEPNKPPRVTIRDEDGTERHKALTLAELLSLLDRSAVLEALEREAVRLVRTPELPPNVLLCSVLEYPTDRDIIVTGWQPPGTWPFVLETRTEAEKKTYVVKLPVLVWRCRWREGTKRLHDLAVALAPVHIDQPNTGTPLYRYPFSNVYTHRGGAVCWPTMKKHEMELYEVHRKGVAEFLGTPNNRDLYGISASQNSDHAAYEDFMQAIEDNGGIEQDWLIPQQIDVQMFHDVGGDIR